MDGQYYVELLATYIRELPPVPTFKEVPEHEVQLASYKHYAAGMLLERFENAYGYNEYAMYEDPVEIVQDFVDEMDYYYNYTPKRNRANLMFYVAREAGKEIGLLFV